jgi:hypothetical protein
MHMGTPRATPSLTQYHQVNRVHLCHFTPSATLPGGCCVLLSMQRRKSDPRSWSRCPKSSELLSSAAGIPGPCPDAHSSLLHCFLFLGSMHCDVGEGDRPPSPTQSHLWTWSTKQQLGGGWEAAGSEVSVRRFPAICCGLPLSWAPREPETQFPLDCLLLVDLGRGR